LRFAEGKGENKMKTKKLWVKMLFPVLIALLFIGSWALISLSHASQPTTGAVSAPPRATRTASSLTAQQSVTSTIYLPIVMKDYLVGPPTPILTMAIYEATADTSDELPPDQVNFDITDPALIGPLITSIDFSEDLDCSRIKAKNNAYVYIKFQDNSVEVYHILMLWSHFCEKDLRDICFYISESGQELFQQYAQ